MNLQTVITNLKNTIAGKEQMLAEKIERNEQGWFNSTSEIVANRATIEFLKINIDELNRILDDLVECEVKGKEFSTWAHWQQNPDRSGGQFTDEEINNADRWI